MSRDREYRTLLQSYDPSGLASGIALEEALVYRVAKQNVLTSLPRTHGICRSCPQRSLIAEGTWQFRHWGAERGQKKQGSYATLRLTLTLRRRAMWFANRLPRRLYR
eukprot:6185243-Pleurochrysis_carterae.AAC.1